ncbi:phospholipase D-like domain-containing protein [Halomonas sp. SpR1]|uniref:phospholipase D-like domain-containing protein n=1 Tax=Halomonas sp. SpR1 TaxID=3050462 RepID=UPI0027E3D825|nr:phospholipase D-like domain-containing protein [Halomonas sp. SpR1]MDQ7731562.1 phospholipase D-like domain-containing protein [Halomonas sp. SpR1]
MNDLNKFQLDNDGNYDRNFTDNSATSSSGVAVYFRNIEEKLLHHIQESDAVFGAVAWLTSYSILDALAELDNVSIVVQKEDFLRPDFGSSSDFKRTLHTKYKALNCKLTRYSFSNILSSISVSSDPSIDPVRCVGNHNSERSPSFPRMHNKFLIFARVEESKEDHGIETVTPYAVWTGSFNITKNATMSLENALYITDKKIVNAYYEEYGQIAAMSEELDWTSDWVAPEWRIGT